MKVFQEIKCPKHDEDISKIEEYEKRSASTL